MFGPDWTVEPTGSGNEHHLIDNRGKVVATGHKGEKMQYVADCVNACERIPDPSVVGELVEALGSCANAIELLLTSPDSNGVAWEDELADARAALAKATQGNLTRKPAHDKPTPPCQSQAS